MWRDNLDENGAAIRMRAGSRDNMMIALSLGLCKPHLRCRSAIALCQSRPGGASCRSSHVRNAPLATVGAKKRRPVVKELPTLNCTTPSS